MKNYTTTEHISFEDYVMIIQDGCIKIISYENFIKQISLGGFSIYEAWLNSIEGIGAFSGDYTPIDTPPTMQDLFVSLSNRQQDKIFTSDDFLSKYYDAEGDSMGKIVVVGGDVNGFTLNGTPIYIGQVITVGELAGLRITARNQDAAYIQDLFFEAYDINNVKATSI